MVKGEVDRACRRALQIFDEWQRVTGCLDGSSYVWELEGIVTDAVHIGIQAAMGIHRPLDSEETEAAPPVIASEDRQMTEHEDDLARTPPLDGAPDNSTTHRPTEDVSSIAPEVWRIALESIANSSCCGCCQEAALVAKKALGKDKT